MLNIGDKVIIKNVSCRFKENCSGWKNNRKNCIGLVGTIGGFVGEPRNIEVYFNMDKDDYCTYNKEELLPIKDAYIETFE